MKYTNWKTRKGEIVDEKPFRYVCRECQVGFEGNCNGCYLLNEQVKNQ